MTAIIIILNLYCILNKCSTNQLQYFLLLFINAVQTFLNHCCKFCIVAKKSASVTHIQRSVEVDDPGALVNSEVASVGLRLWLKLVHHDAVVSVVYVGGRDSHHLTAHSQVLGYWLQVVLRVKGYSILVRSWGHSKRAISRSLSFFYRQNTDLKC